MNPLLPLSVDNSVENDKNLYLRLFQKGKRKAIDSNVLKDKNLITSSDIDSEEENFRNLSYSNLPSSSSSIYAEQNRLSQKERNDKNDRTSSTIPIDNYTDIISSDSIPQIITEIPSSPIMQSQSDFAFKPDPLRSDFFKDLDLIDDGNNKNDSNTNDIKNNSLLKLSPNLFPISHSTGVGSKQIHSLSRNNSSLVEPNRKKQKKVETKSNIKRIKFTKPKSEFALDRDGKVYGYSLENDNFPCKYGPNLYTEPTYFVVKNSKIQSQIVSELIAQLFDHEPNHKNPVYNLNLQRLDLKSLPEQVADFQDLILYGKSGIIKPFLQLDASNNLLRSISPKLLKIDRLQLLSLRNNKIARLPGAIESAKNLKSINLAMNKFKFLPHNILKLNNNLEVMPTTNNPMIPCSKINLVYEVDKKLLNLYNTDLIGETMELKSFSELHWMKNDKQISKTGIHAKLISRSLSTIQDLCYDECGNFKGWNSADGMIIDDDDEISGFTLSISQSQPLSLSQQQNHQQRAETESDKMKKEEQIFLAKKSSWNTKLSELALRQISKYLISESEIMKWKDTTHDYIYNRAMKALIHGTNGETCGYCEHTCIESVAEMLEWWDFKGSKMVTIKRRFCSKRCAFCWINKLKKVTKQ